MHDAGAPDEAAGGPEVVGDSGEEGAHAPDPPAEVELAAPERCRGRDAAGAGPAGGELEVRAVDPAEDDPPVEVRHPVVVAAVDPVRPGQSDPRTAAEIALGAEQIDDGMIQAGRGSESPVHRRQQAEVRAERVAGELDRGDRLHDPAGVDEVAGDLEELAALQEERALLRKEQRLAWIERQLPGVRFHLREVGLDGAVEGEVVAESPAQVSSHLRPADVVPVSGAPGGGGGDGGARHLARRLRVHVHDQTAVQAGEPDELARLADEGRARAPGRRPGVLEAGVLHLSHDVETPALHLAALVAEASKGDPHLHFVPPLRDAPPRLVDIVGGQIGLLPPGGGTAEEPAGTGIQALDDRAVPLHAQRVHREHEGPVPVVERAQEDLDVVVAEDLIAVGQARRGAAVPLERPDAEIDRGRRVPDQDLRGVRRGHAVVGGVLGEAGEERGPGPDRLVEPAVHGDGGVDARRLHLRPAVVARGGRRRRERRDRQEERRRRHRGQRPYFRRILLTSSSGIASTRVPLASVVVAVKSAS